MNNCNFIGRIGKDAVLRHTQSGEPVTGWSLATEAGYGDKKVTTWVDCSLWGKRAEALTGYIKKGDRIAVTGELSTREHDGKTYVTLKVSEVTLLGDKKADTGQRQSASPRGGGPISREPTASPAYEDDFSDDKIPFATNRGEW
jgi:single-strand DNA-binding protein